MDTGLYTTTDSYGVQRVGDHEVRWSLPPAGGGPGEVTTAPAGAALVLMTLPALLDELGERIFVAQPEDGPGRPDVAGHVETGSARLLADTSWDTERAASFALDCAEHALGDAATSPLPDGATLGEVVRDARDVLRRSGSDAERRLGRLARLAEARRLRRRGDELADVALATLDDLERTHLDAFDEPAWTTAASAREAVLAAVEALRHLAFPRYVEAREHTKDATDSDTPSLPSRIITTPWGPITAGAPHFSNFQPAWIGAREAARRARDAARDRGGEEAEATELAWQTERLGELLAGGGRTS